MARFRNDDRESIRDVLEDNIGRVCTVFTSTGGRAGEGFTGIVASVCGDTCRVITALPSTPDIRPFFFDDDDDDDDRGCGCRRRRDRWRRNEFGTSCNIPLDQITCVATRDV